MDLNQVQQELFDQYWNTYGRELTDESIGYLTDLVEKEMEKPRYMKVKLINEYAIAPERANPTDAGVDLFSPYHIDLMPHESRMIDLGIVVELPPGTVGYIFARSGIATKYGVRPRNCVGVIDEKYRGEDKVMIENANFMPYTIHKGDRIAQLVISPILTPEVEIVDEVNMDGDRGGGFGSTGK
jgi:dUTP pyrophosphatase